MLQRSDSASLPPQAMRKTLKQMMKAPQKMLTHKRTRPRPLIVRSKRETSLRPRTMGTMVSKTSHSWRSTEFRLSFSCVLSSTEDITSHHSSSSSFSSDPEESDEETDIGRPKESDHEGTEERAPPNPEEPSEVEPKESEVQNSTEDSTETNISVSTGPSGTENQPNADTSDDERKMADESKQEEEQERGEQKSAITRTSCWVRTRIHL